MRFTPRQARVVELLAAGYMLKQAAGRMGISNHRAGQLVAFAARANGCSTTAQLLYRYGQSRAAVDVTADQIFLSVSNFFTRRAAA